MCPRTFQHLCSVYKEDIEIILRSSKQKLFTTLTSAQTAHPRTTAGDSPQRHQCASRPHALLAFSSPRRAARKEPCGAGFCPCSIAFRGPGAPCGSLRALLVVCASMPSTASGRHQQQGTSRFVKMSLASKPEMAARHVDEVPLVRLRVRGDGGLRQVRLQRALPRISTFHISLIRV